MAQDSESLYSAYSMASFEDSEVAESSSSNSFVVPRLSPQRPSQPSDNQAAQPAAVTSDDELYTVDVNTNVTIDDAAALSPSDGYFQPRSAAADVWARDPSLEQHNPSETKAKGEADEHRYMPPTHQAIQPFVAVPNPPDYRRYPPIRRTGDIRPSSRPESVYSQQSSIPSEAPPAYTPSSSISSTIGSRRSIRNVGQGRNSRYTVFTAPSSSRSRSLGGATRSYSTFISEPVTMGGSRHEDDDGLEAEESSGLLSGRRNSGHREPQSMADGVPDEEVGLMRGDGESEGRRSGLGKRVPWVHGRNCRMVAVAVVLLTLAVGFLISWGVSGNKKEVTVPGEKDGATLPGKEPVNGGDDNVMDPPRSYPVFEGPPTFSDTRCKASPADLPTQKFSIDISQGKRLAIIQNVSETDQLGTDVHVSGEVVFRRAYDGGESSSVVIELVANDPSITPEITLSTSQDLTITAPRNIPGWSGGGVPCLSIRATAWIPASSTLDDLSINTIHLAIDLLSDLSLVVSGATTINTIVAPIIGATTGADNNAELISSGALPATYTFNSREIVVHTLSAPIKGSWPLYDLLDLKTTSGSIEVGVAPKSAAEDDPRPAVLSVKSTSGTIKVFEPVRTAMQSWAATLLLPVGAPADALIATNEISPTESHLPPRDYRATIESTSASIHVELAFSSLAYVRSFSGTVTASLLPVLPARLAAPQLSAAGGGWRAQLQTHTTSGSTTVGCLDPMWYDDTSGLGGVRGGRYVSTTALPVPNATVAGAGGGNYLHVMTSKHESTSGTMKLVYPASWEGDIGLSSVSGRLGVTGEGVRIIGMEDRMGYNELRARKGSQGAWEASGITGRTTSGNMRVEFPR